MRIASLFALLISFFELQGQNLVANGSFEDENICTEYHQNCAPEAWISNALKSNNYFDDSIHAYNGKHFIGVITGNSRVNAVRTFMRTRLLCGLRKGHQYRINFVVQSRHPVFDSIGIYFSPNDFLYERKLYHQLSPVLFTREGQAATSMDRMKWNKMSLLYTATGDENFLTIGSFKKQEHRYFAPPENKGNYYMYIDDLKLEPLDTHEQPCHTADSVKLAIYNDNARHELMEKRTAFYKRDVPQEPVAPYTILQKIDTLIIPDVLFASGSSALHDKTTGVLDSFCNQLTSKSIDSILVEGHTDSIGTLAYNNKLSADRAGVVSSYIVRQSGVDSRKMYVRFYAYSRPAATNLTSQGRQRNRRVEIYLYTHE